jgi:hypothetical protein
LYQGPVAGDASGISILGAFAHNRSRSYSALVSSSKR